MKKVVILIGVPGSGKGTQAQKLIQEYGYCHISTGDLLRKLEKDMHADPVERQQLEDMKSGKLVADELIYTLAFRALDACFTKEGGAILDGAVRTLAQAERFYAYFTEHNLLSELCVVELYIPDEHIAERIRARVADGEGRSDDVRPEVIQNRIAQQGNMAIAPIVSFFKEKDILLRIDGTQDIGVVYNKLLECVKKDT